MTPLTNNMKKVRKVKGYPQDYWFFDEWEVFDWCNNNNIDITHVHSSTIHGYALIVNSQDIRGLTLFLIKWT
jgi:hypothetical protein